VPLRPIICACQIGDKRELHNFISVLDIIRLVILEE